MNKILEKKSFPRWVAHLKSHTVYGPVSRGDTWHFQEVDRPEDIDLDYAQAIESPKTLIFPAKEVLFEFERTGNDSWNNRSVPIDDKPAVVFGIRPCEARALLLTDRVFGGDIRDPYYWRRRDRAALVGLACTTPPSEDCFCTSVHGSPHSSEGMDILMTDLGEFYFVEAETDRGEALIGRAADLFRPAGEAQRKTVKDIHDRARDLVKRSLPDVEAISSRLSNMFDDPIWEVEAIGCIRCGICTYLCPTCHCFDINDEITRPIPLKGQRVRTWDTCQFPDFTMHSSGHNPRPHKASRLRQRILHKFSYFKEREGVQQCTGCGRCISHCPVGIDLIEILTKVEHDG